MLRDEENSDSKSSLTLSGGAAPRDAELKLLPNAGRAPKDADALPPNEGRRPAEKPLSDIIAEFHALQIIRYRILRTTPTTGDAGGYSCAVSEDRIIQIETLDSRV